MKKQLSKYANAQQSESGAALAMVLIFIVLFSLLMSSVGILIRSSNVSAQTSKAQNLLRANIVYSVIPQALAKLTQNGVRYGMADPLIEPCDQRAFPGGMTFPIQIPSISDHNGYSDTVTVDCIQSPKSGTSQPIASFALTGTDCYIPSAQSDCLLFTSYGNLNTSGVVGQDGGLKLDPGMTNPPLLVTGGLINASGAWDAPANTLRLKKKCETETAANVTITSGSSDGEKVTFITADGSPLSGWAVGNKITITYTSNAAYNFTSQEIIQILSANKFVIQPLLPAVAPSSNNPLTTSATATAQICPSELNSQITQPTDSELVNCPSYQKYNSASLTGGVGGSCSCPWSAIGASATKTITKKTRASGTATLTSVGHGFKAGSLVTVTDVDTTFNGSYTITEVTDDTFSYSNTAANVAFTNSPGSATVPLFPSSCPTGLTGFKFSSINPEDTSSDLGAYISSISSALEDVRSSTLAVIPGDCSSSANIFTQNINGRSFKSVRIYPGYINAAKLSDLNALLAKPECGNGFTKPAIQFMPGIYRFNLLSGLDKSTANTLTIGVPQSDANLTVIGGDACSGQLWCNDSTAANPKFECGDVTNQNGVQFQFEGAVYLDVRKGLTSLCPIGTKPIIAAPARTRAFSNTGNDAPFFWLGARDKPIFQNFAGSSSGKIFVDFKGQVFAPAGYFSLRFNGETAIVFRKGLIARALTIAGTGNASSASEVAPPSPFNGDRIVQLRLKSSKMGDLGIVQLVIRDYFGRRLASGYKIISWRTAW